jgi:hypothetical protein
LGYSVTVDGFGSLGVGSSLESATLTGFFFGAILTLTHDNNDMLTLSYKAHKSRLLYTG